MLAASLGHLACRQRDAIGLTLFADKIQTHLRPRGTADHQLEFLHALSQQQDHPVSKNPLVLHEIAELSPRRGLKVLISDCYFPQEQIADAVAHFRHYGHEMILFHVLTSLESKMPVSGLVRFRDMETGEEIVTQAEAIRDEFVGAVNQWQSDLRALCQLHEIDYVAVDSDTPLTVALREYFQVRSELF